MSLLNGPSTTVTLPDPTCPNLGTAQYCGVQVTATQVTPSHEPIGAQTLGTLT